MTRQTRAASNGVAKRLAELRLLADQRRHNRAPRREEGQILVLFTIVIIVIMLFASIVIDVGVLRNNRQILVNAVDAAALAGGTKMPVNGCTNKNQPETSNCLAVDNTEVTAAIDLVTSTLAASYPGIGTSGSWVAGAYTITGATYTVSITFRCLIGVDTSTPPQPYISRDIPTVCNPRMALGHTPVAADFKGAGPTRYSVCRPDLGDKCNVVFVASATDTPYSFGRVVGINQGSTGTVASAACNGPCGQPPAAPVDLVVLVDRTGSMSNTQMGLARDAARSILGVYDPSLQRVAVGFMGLSSQMTTCSGSGGGPAVNADAMSPGTLTAPSIAGSTTANVQSNANVTGGFTQLSIARPTTSAANDILIANITVSGNVASITAPPASGTPATNWNLINRVTNAGGNLTMFTYWYRTPATSPAGPFIWTGFPANTRAAGEILRFTGAVTSGSPIQASSVASGVSSTTVTAASVTTTAQNALVGFYANVRTAAGANGTTFTPPGGSPTFTERADRATANADGTPWISTEAATATATTAGATGTKAATAAGAGIWVAQLIALKPVPVDTYGATYPADLAKWIPIGFTGTDSDSPSQAWNEAYSDGNGVIDDTTHIASAINCGLASGAQSGVGTNLTTPIAMAAAYLQNYGRPNVKWGILMETDGEPNYNGYGSQNGEYTCQSAVDAATAAKAITNANGQHIEVFTVGYFDSNVNCPDGSGGGYASTSYNGDRVTTALADMASTKLSPNPPYAGGATCDANENTDQDHFFCQPGTSDLETVFRTIATQFAGIRTHLVQIDPLPIVYSISPTTGPGATVITVTGKYFTGVNSGCSGCGVTFNGAAVTPSAVSDTSLKITAPSGAPGAFDIIITTPSGSSLTHSGSRFTRT